MRQILQRAEHDCPRKYPLHLTEQKQFHPSTVSKLNQKCWLNVTLPSIWKQSVIIPILKQGIPKSNLFDVKKAYDSVWHARLLYKLRNIGITGVMFRSF